MSASESQQTAEPTTAAPTGPRFPLDLQSHLREAEQMLVESALESADYHQKNAASLLGLSYDQMRGLVRKHGIRTRAPRGN